MPVRFTRPIPVLASLDMARTEAFYREKLGFETIIQQDNYLGMRRGELVLHFWKCESRLIAENTSCYVEVEGIDELHAAYEAQGVIHPNGALRNQPYGMREFAILDPDGNLITFGQPLPEDENTEDDH